MDRSSRGGGNVGNALFAFSKEEENPRSWFWGFSSSGISTAGWIYETLIAGLDHPCSFDSPTNSAIEPKEETCSVTYSIAKICLGLNRNHDPEHSAYPEKRNRA